MADAMIDRIADAVLAVVQGATLSLTVTAAAASAPIFDLEDLETVRVSVVPVGVGEEIADRTRDQCEYRLQLILQRRVPLEGVTGLDETKLRVCRKVLEELDDLFRHGVLEESGERLAAWNHSEIVTINDPKHLHEKHLYTGVLTLTFLVLR